MRAEYGPNGEKACFSGVVMVLHSFYVKLLLIYLISKRN